MAIEQVLMKLGMLSSKKLKEGLSRKEAFQAAGMSLIETAQSDSKILYSVKGMATYGPSIGLAWMESAFAMVEPSHRLSASLMCTSIPSEHLQDVIMPWRCFGIRVPVGILAFPGPEYLIVIRRPGGVVGCFQLGPALAYGEEPSLGDWANMEGVSVSSLGAKDDTALPVEYVDVVLKNQILLGRLIVGVCLELERFRTTATKQMPSNIRTDRRGEPKTWAFKLTRPVKIDTRAAVRAYLRGETSSAPGVQTLVRGHHKFQPYGPGRSGKRWIHVEPYWRGPEDAPIALRSHVLTRTE